MFIQNELTRILIQFDCYGQEEILWLRVSGSIGTATIRVGVCASYPRS